MSYGYVPDLVTAERFQQHFAGDIVQCLQDLGVADILSEEELRQILVYMNQNHPFQTNGTFSGFESDSLLRARADVLHRLYSTWWAELMMEITPEERQKIVSGLCVILAAAKGRDWNRPEPMAASFSAG